MKKLASMKVCLSAVLAMAARVASAGDDYAVFSEHGQGTGDNVNKDLSCWVCNRADKGTATCLGTQELPYTAFPTKEQAGGAACVLVRRGTCLTVQNHDCGNAASERYQQSLRKKSE